MATFAQRISFLFLSLVCFWPALSFGQSFNRAQCVAEVREARHSLLAVFARLARAEREDRAARLRALLGPRPGHTPAALGQRGDNLTEECGGPPAPTPFPPPGNDIELQSIFPTTGSEDHYIRYVETLHSNLRNEAEICRGPGFVGFDSITEEQFYAALTIFATTYADPLCPVCADVLHAIMANLVAELVKLGPKYEFLVRALQAFLPQTDTICKIIFPRCDQYNGTVNFSSSQCFKCNFCMTSMTLLEHNFLLVRRATDLFYRSLEALVLRDLCRELCYAYPPHATPQPRQPLFPRGITQAECLADARLAYAALLRLAQLTLIPDRICPLINVCEPHPTPNIIHCLHAYCADIQKRFSYLAIICDLIPDHPEAADDYLNVAEQKRQLRAKLAHYNMGPGEAASRPFPSHNEL